jgi:misacylated tRNA(Ala) deacylase
MSNSEKKRFLTKLLYYEDAYLKKFNAEVLEIKKIEDRYSVVLDRTAFYPAGGGQPADMGAIKGNNGKVKVFNTKMADGTVLHIADEVEGELRAGEKVEATIDWDRRYTLMKNHSAAHLMAEALRRATGTPLKIIGSAIDVEKARLDFAYEKSLGPLLPMIEEVANRLIKEDRLVEIRMMKRKEAEEYVKRFHESLEILPPQVENVRIVEIKGLHACACGGTHVKSTSEIGNVRVLKRRSKGKGVERLEFVAKSHKN